MKDTGLSPCLTAAFLHGNKSVSYSLLQLPICKKKGWFSSVSQRWAKHLKSLMSVKCIHFLRWKLLLMCEVLLGLLLLINKEGRAILFLGRLTQGTRMPRLGKMVICTKGDPLPVLSLKATSVKHRDKPSRILVGCQPTGDLPRSADPLAAPVGPVAGALGLASGGMLCSPVLDSTKYCGWPRGGNLCRR